MEVASSDSTALSSNKCNEYLFCMPMFDCLLLYAGFTKRNELNVGKITELTVF